jgi:hypothetical protein
MQKIYQKYHAIALRIIINSFLANQNGLTIPMRLTFPFPRPQARSPRLARANWLSKDLPDRRDVGPAPIHAE